MSLTPEQMIKIHLVALAEFLQCTLSDHQLLLYARELAIDPDQLALAIALLKQDADVWPGRFPLPAKIKSYLTGDLEDQANSMVVNIMLAVDDGESSSWAKLTSEEKEVVKVYGWVNLSNMMIGQRPNYITNMKSIAKTIISKRKRPELVAVESQAEILKLAEDNIWENT